MLLLLLDDAQEKSHACVHTTHTYIHTHTHTYTHIHTYAQEKLPFEQHVSNYADSKFCLAPAGYGFSSRQYECVLVGCVPVVIQVCASQKGEMYGMHTWRPLMYTYLYTYTHAHTHRCMHIHDMHT